MQSPVGVLRIALRASYEVLGGGMDVVEPLLIGLLWNLVFLLLVYVGGGFGSTK